MTTMRPVRHHPLPWRGCGTMEGRKKEACSTNSQTPSNYAKFNKVSLQQSAIHTVGVNLLSVWLHAGHAAVVPSLGCWTAKRKTPVFLEPDQNGCAVVICGLMPHGIQSQVQLGVSLVETEEVTQWSFEFISKREWCYELDLNIPCSCLYVVCV